MDNNGADEASTISVQQYQSSRKRETKKSGHAYTMFVSDDSDDGDFAGDVTDGNNRDELICAEVATPFTAKQSHPHEEVKSPSSKLKKHG